MKRIKNWIAALLGTLAAVAECLTPRRKAVALPNELGLITEGGIESLLIDPTASLPVASRYLVYKRGATGYQYCNLCGQSDTPLGVSSDSPYQAGDFVNIRRLGNKKGFELGIPATAINQDDLVLTAANGQVQAFTGAANGTYWVIGRCLKTVAATNIEVAYVPMTPRKMVNNNGWSETIA